MHILHVDSSINGPASVSSVISQAIVDRLLALDPSAEVTRRDLAAHPLPHFTTADFADNAVVDEFLSAETIVVGAPMYNFSVPTQLKAWLDRLAIPGKTFRYTANGPEGLSGGRKLIVASSRGGFYGSDTPQVGMDHQESYLKVFFGFLGLTDITFVHTEGVRMSDEARFTAIDAAHHQIRQMAV